MGKWKAVIDQIDFKKDEAKKIVMGLVFLCSQVDMDAEDDALLEEKIVRFYQYRRNNPDADRIMASFLQKLIDDKEFKRIIDDGKSILTDKTPEKDWLYMSYSKNGQYLRGYLSLRNRLNAPRMQIDEDGKIQRVEKLKKKDYGDIMERCIAIKAKNPSELFRFSENVDQFYQAGERKQGNEITYPQGIPNDHIHYMVRSIPMTTDKRKYITEQFTEAGLEAGIDREALKGGPEIQNGFTIIDKEDIKTSLQRMEDELTRIKVSKGHENSAEYDSFYSILQECCAEATKLDKEKLERLQRAAKAYTKAKTTLGIITYKATAMGKQRFSIAREVYNLCKPYTKENNQINQAADPHRVKVNIKDVAGGKNGSGLRATGNVIAKGNQSRTGSIDLNESEIESEIGNNDSFISENDHKLVQSIQVKHK